MYHRVCIVGTLLSRHQTFRHRPMHDKRRVLFVCSGNSCRSQMAEGFCRHIWKDVFDCESAGIERHGLNANAVKVMQEISIDISGHESKTIDELESLSFDYVITVCGHTNETCPVFPSDTRIIHHGFDDPPRLAAEAHSESEALNHYRRVRDEIGAFVHDLRRRVAPGRDQSRQ